MQLGAGRGQPGKKARETWKSGFLAVLGLVIQSLRNWIKLEFCLRNGGGEEFRLGLGDGNNPERNLFDQFICLSSVATEPFREDLCSRL